MKKINKKTCLPARSLFKAFSCHCQSTKDIMKDKKNPGRSNPILWNDGNSNVNKSKRISNFFGLRPYFSLTRRKINHRKKGSMAMRERRKENLHVVKVKNLGARENAKAENQRLL